MEEVQRPRALDGYKVPERIVGREANLGKSSSNGALR